MAYQDNGVYFIEVISNQGKVVRSLNVSKFIKIDDKSKPLCGFWEPLITGVFIDDDTLFIAAYHRLNMDQYHFTY